MRTLQLAFAIAIVLVTGAGYSQSQNATAAAPYTVLDDQADQLRADFNRKVGSVRLLFVVDPICPTCLRGLADMNRDLLKDTSDSRLQTFVVHAPVLGVARGLPWVRIAGGKDVPKAGQLLENPNVRHYWNASGDFGRLLSRAVGLKSSDRQEVYAWDVWLLYGPDAKWEGADPPRPLLLMHQLGALHGSAEFPHLDSHLFAQRVRTLLAQLPHSPSTAAPTNQVHP
jgi:hypothetical protein